MGIVGSAGWHVGRFMAAGDVTSAGFRQKGLDALAERAGEGAGFLVITSHDATPGELIDAGRRCERMAQLLRERGLAVHPMSQLVEGAALARRARRATRRLDAVPQLVARIGRLER